MVKCADRQTPPIFQPDNWKRVLSSLTNLYWERAKLEGRSAISSKETASDDDLDAVGLLRLWDGTPTMAEMMHLDAIMVNTAGRGTESAMTPKRFLTLETREEQHLKYSVIRHHVDLHKTRKINDLHVFPHRNSPFRCYYFTLAYNFLVAQPGQCDYVLREFSHKAVANQQADARSQSLVAKHWRKIFTDLLQECDGYDFSWDNILDCSEEFTINPRIQSHGNKRNSIKQMASYQLPAMAVIFRGGWETRNLHTIFDYFAGSAKHDVDAGKVCAGWKHLYAGEYWGGYTPSSKT